MTGPTEEAYQAALQAHGAMLDGDRLRAAVDAVWPIAVAEGRRQAAEAIQANLAQVAAEADYDSGVLGPGDTGFLLGGEWAARIAGHGTTDRCHICIDPATITTRPADNPTRPGEAGWALVTAQPCGHQWYRRMEANHG